MELPIFYMHIYCMKTQIFHKCICCVKTRKKLSDIYHILNIKQIANNLCIYLIHDHICYVQYNNFICMFNI